MINKQQDSKNLIIVKLLRKIYEAISRGDMFVCTYNPNMKNALKQLRTLGFHVHFISQTGAVFLTWDPPIERIDNLGVTYRYVAYHDGYYISAGGHKTAASCVFEYNNNSKDLP
jgi:hypothetical protein